MGSFFNYDNKFFSAVNKAVDCFFISVLWVIFSIPIFTIGASTTALYDTIHRVIRKEVGYVFRTFWGSFRSNFKQTTKIWLIMLVFIAFLSADIWLLWKPEEKMEAILFYFFVIALVLIILWALYTFSYSARFELDMKGTMKNSALLAIVNLPWSVLMLVVLAVAALVIYFLPIAIVLLPAIVFLIYERILEKLFRKIMSPEDLEKEMEDI